MQLSSAHAICVTHVSIMVHLVFLCNTVDQHRTVDPTFDWLLLFTDFLLVSLQVYVL